ncbi:MAG: AarF/ABC1/UbiB kinase family protein [Planctomycetes bacterium]|nr:AarF/ABC1/UbiB kinase family protein [Planctomycetota bacterium]
MVLRRSFAGLVLLARLGIQYLLIAQLKRISRRAARAWRTRLDRSGGRLIAAHARRHGGLLIKIGQYIASRPDIFPLAYVDACAPLRDQAPARPFAVVAAVLDEVYEGRTAKHFARIEETPLAAASFGQVHRAWLADDGRLVAVKIQYPELATTVAADLWLVRLAVRLFALLLPGFPLITVYEEISRTSREEQDYLHEGSAADRLRPGLAERGLRVPVVLWPHTREKVLVMEYAAGTTLGMLELGPLGERERRRLADVIIESFLYMLLEMGFFHADPHAGNFIYDTTAPQGPQLWLIDFGMTSSITRREAALYRDFLDCLRRNDTDGMIDLLTKLGWVLPGADLAHLRVLAREVFASLGHLSPTTFKGSRREAELGAKIAEFLRRIDGLVLPRHTIMLSRATGLIEGVCMELVPGTNLLDLIRPRLAGLTGLRTQLSRWWQDLQETWKAYRGLPERVEALAARPAPAQRSQALLAALLLIAALQLEPGTVRTIAASVAGCAVAIAVLRGK